MNQKIVVFVSLFIDLLAFTLILPLFPKIFDYYAANPEVNVLIKQMRLFGSCIVFNLKDLTYNFMQANINQFRELIADPAKKDSLNSVLFGGISVIDWIYGFDHSKIVRPKA